MKKMGRPASEEKKILVSGFFLPAKISAKLERIISKRKQTKRDFFIGAVERANE